MKPRDLTQRYVETVRATGARLEVRDSRSRGLELRVTSQGTKTWLLRYRRKSDGKKRSVTLGRFPEMPLQEARQAALEARAAIGKGSDPAGDQATLRAALTFRELASKRLEDDQTIGAGTRAAYHQSLGADVFPAIGDVPAAAVTADMVARVLDAIEKRGSPVQADRTRAAVGSTFKWAIKRRVGGIAVDPTAGLGKRAPDAKRTRLLSQTELKTFWTAIHSEDSPLTEPLRLICQLAMLTGQRRSEVAGAKRSEIQLSDEPLWTIPGDTKRNGVYVRGRTKNRKNQVVPLSREAAQRFARATELSQEQEFVFPADTRHVRTDTTRLPHIHGESVTRAVTRLCDSIGLEDVAIHDLRRCISTWLGDRGTRPDVIDLILNHQPRDVTRRHYNLATMLPHVRAALQDWASYLDGL